MSQRDVGVGLHKIMGDFRIDETTQRRDFTQMGLGDQQNGRMGRDNLDKILASGKISKTMQQHNATTNGRMGRGNPEKIPAPGEVSKTAAHAMM